MKHLSKHAPYYHVLHRVLSDLIQRIPELSHCDSQRVLITLGQAKDKSRASIRGFYHPTKQHQKPIVFFRRMRIRYEIILRPLFFFKSTPRQRLQTLIHELYHCTHTFDGTLAIERRHACMHTDVFKMAIQHMLSHYYKVMPSWVLSAVSGTQEVSMFQWIQRPPNLCSSEIKRKMYNHQDLFLSDITLL